MWYDKKLVSRRLCPAMGGESVNDGRLKKEGSINITRRRRKKGKRR